MHDLWGATDAAFEAFGLATLEENRQVRELFRGEVGAPPSAYPAVDAWANGHAMTLQQAIAYALTEETVAAADLSCSVVGVSSAHPRPGPAP